MKKIFFILLCFTVVFAAFAIDMSPQPGDTLETVVYVQGDVVAMSQAVSAPTLENVLHFDQFNYNNSFEICLSANEEINGIYNFNPGLNADMAVSDIGYEMEPVFYKTGEDVAVYHLDYG